MLLSKRDLKATDTGAPFGGGVSPMSGGSQPGSGSAHEANPSHSGPPPAAAGASHIIRCNECGKVCSDGGELDEHMRKEHFVRQTLSSRNDVTVPAALIFIDGLGDTLPFKSSFTFKELSDFCHREGVILLSGETLTDTELIRIAENVAVLTNNHVQIEPKPTVTADRSPLSAIDLSVASKSGEKTCRRCETKIAGYRLFCDEHRQQPGEKTDKQAIEMYANVTLRNGANVHVVEITGEQYIGMDELFVAHDFTAADAAVVHNLTEDLRTVEASRCDMCGEERFAFAAKCPNCGHAEQS
jgi:ferredoxin